MSDATKRTIKGRTRVRTPARRPRIPPLRKPLTYLELAHIVVQLVEANIANVDTPEDRFVSCFTYGAGNIPPHWIAAIKARERLIVDLMIPRPQPKEKR